MFMQYKLIVHIDFLKAIAFDMNTSAGLRSKAEEALRTIEDVLGESNTLRIGSGDPRNIPEVIKPGDHVILYGARHGACLSVVGNALAHKGVRAEYHPKGYI
jgi:hypothetical protein